MPEERVEKILSLLEKAYPDAGLILRYKNPLELLVATIMAAQPCRAVRAPMICVMRQKQWISYQRDYMRLEFEWDETKAKANF